MVAFQALVLLGAFLVSVGSPKDCALVVAPQVSLAPLTYLRMRVTIEPRNYWRYAWLELVDEVSELRRSSVYEPDSIEHMTRTTQVEWKSLHIPEGSYEAHLYVTGLGGERCGASASITVN